MWLAVINLHPFGDILHKNWAKSFSLQNYSKELKYVLNSR